MNSELIFILTQATRFAREVDLLFLYIMAVCLFFGTLIAVLIIIFAVQYHQRKGEPQHSEDVKESLLLEMAWMGIPLALVLSMFFWGAKLYIEQNRPPPGTLDIFVVGKQWMWKLQHTEGKREINELHVPVNRPVKLTMTSEDVIHSFFVPAFRIKMDLVPGRYTTVWFEADKVGEYHLFCAEYCGTKHAGMIGRVVVMSQAGYEAWLSTQGAGDTGQSIAQHGEQLFDTLGCKSCHTTESGARGPNLAGVYGHAVNLQSGRTVTADEAYLRESILKPMAKVVKGYEPVMPTYVGQVDEESLLALIAYLKTLHAEGK